MNGSLQRSANENYERTRLESAQTVLKDRRTLVTTWACRQPTSKLPLSGPQLQAVAQLYAEHIERCVRARFTSYQDAYNSIGETPTSPELMEILKETKAAEDQETRHAATTLQQFALANGMTIGKGTSIDPAGVIASQFTGIHDLVVQDWKKWKADIEFKAEALKKQKDRQRVKPTTSWANVRRLMWSWGTVAGVGLLLLGSAWNPIYAGDVVMTFVLCVLGLLLLTAKLINWDQTKNLRFRNGVNAGAIILSVVLLLFVVGLARSRAPQPGPTPLITMQISPSILPIYIPAHTEASVLQLHPYIGLTDDRDGLLKIANDTGREGCWPTQAEVAQAGPDHEKIYRLEISNHS